MIKPNGERFEFDAFRLDAAEHLLLRDGEPVPLEPKVFETLLVLIRHDGRLVGKEELMRAVWPDMTGGDESSYFDLYGKGAFKVEAERRGYIVACPKGRQPTSMYLGTAQKDVLDVLAEVGRAYRVDPDRIYLTGHSMGGYGTWSVAMAHPELFAAIAPISGGGNPSGLTKIARIPELVVHGDNDKTVSVEESRKMVAAAKAAGIELKYIEIPGGDHNGAALRTFGDVFDWFDAHKKPAAATPK